MARSPTTRRFDRTLCSAALAGLITAAFCVPAQAFTFTEAFEAARSHDAAYRAAERELQAVRLGVPIARASLLPSVSLSASDSNTQGSRRFANGLNQEVQTRLDYSSPQASLQMRMPLFNFEAFNGYKQSQVQSEVAEENFRAQGLDLLDRLATAYLQVLLSEEAANLATTQVRTLETQLAQVQQRQQRGEGTRVQIAQSQASLDVARARELEARDQVDLARRQLFRLTGVQGAALASLPAVPAPATVFPNRLGDWLEVATRQSPGLKARERYVEVTRLAVKRQFAGHLPRVDLVSSLSRSDSESTNTIGQRSTLRTVGVQMSIPIFNGGGVEASVEQAQARNLQADEDVRNERESLAVDVQRFFQAISNGTQKIRAYQTAVDSSALAWQGARRSLELGLGTLNDVADAQAAHFTARRDLAQARIDQLVSLVRLKARAGVPMAEVVAEIDGLLAAPAANNKNTAQP